MMPHQTHTRYFLLPGLMALSLITLSGVYSGQGFWHLLFLGAIATAGALWLWTTDRRGLKRLAGEMGAVKWPLAAWLIFALLTAPASADRGLTESQLIQTLAYAALMVMFLDLVATDRHVRQTIHVILLLGWLMGLAGAYFYWGQGLREASPTMLSLFGNKNHLAGYLSLVIPLSLALYLTSNRAWQRLIYGVTTAFLSICLILTFSRGGWASLLPSLVLLMAWSLRGAPAREVLRDAALLVAAVVLVVLAVRGDAFRRAVGAGSDAVRSVAQATHERAEPDTTFDHRLGYWRAAVDIMRRYPLTGSGLGTFRELHRQYAQEVFKYSKYAHNFFLQMGAELGVPGLIISLWFVGSLGWTAVFALRRTQATPLQPIAVGLTGGMAASVLHNLVDLDWYIPAIAILFWLEAGLLLRLASGLRPSEEGVAWAVSDRALLVAFTDAVIEGSWLTIIAGVSVLFYLYGPDHFTLPKTALFRFLVGLSTAVWLARAALLQDGSIVDRIRGAVHTPLAVLASLFAAVYLLSTLTSINRPMSFWGSYRRWDGAYAVLTSVFFFLLVIHHLRSRTQTRRVLNAVAAGAGVVSLIGIAQYVGLDPVFRDTFAFDRPIGTMGNPIFLAAYLVLSIPLTLAACQSKFVESPRRVGVEALAGSGQIPAEASTPGFLSDRLPGALIQVVGSWRGQRSTSWQPVRDLIPVIALAVSLLLQVVCIVLTKSRGPWLGLVAGVTSFGILIALRQRKVKLLWGITALFLAASLFVATLNLPDTPLRPLVTQPFLSRLASLGERQTGTEKVRLLIWRGVLQLILHPRQIGWQTDRLTMLRPVIGYGPETLIYAFQTVYPPELGHVESPQVLADRAHNWVLQLGVTVGLLGLLAFTLVLLAALRLGWRTLWRASDTADQTLVAACLAAVIGHAVEGLFGIATTETRVMLWLSLALIVVLSRLVASVQTSEVLAEDSTLWRDQRSPVQHLAVHAETSEVSLTLEPQREGRKVSLAVAGLAGAFLIVLFSTVANVNLVRADIAAGRGIGLGEAGLYEEAAAEYKQAIDLAPSHTVFYDFLARLYLDRALNEDDPAEKLRWLTLGSQAFAQARAREPLLATLYDGSGQLYAHWGESLDAARFQDALAFYEKAVALNPYQPYLRANYAHVYRMMGQPEKAIEVLETTLAIDPLYGPAFQQMGQIYQEMGDLEAAEGAYVRATELRPPIWEAYQGLAEVRMLRGNFAAALEPAQAYANAQPDDWAGHNMLAAIFYQLERYDESLGEAQKALDLAPEAQKPAMQRFVEQVSRVTR